jgi:hypothetical protein
MQVYYSLDYQFSRHIIKIYEHHATTYVETCGLTLKLTLKLGTEMPTANVTSDRKLLTSTFIFPN